MADKLPDLSKLTLKEEESSKPFQKEYTHRTSGTDKDGNHYCLRDYGPDTMNKYPYHYSNTDGGFGYSNPDGSRYHEDKEGKSWYEPLPGVNLFRDGRDGQWTRQSLKSQPGISSSGLEELQRVIGPEFPTIAKHIQSEDEDRGIEHEYIDNSASNERAKELSSWEETVNGEHRGQKDGICCGDEINQDIVGDDAGRYYNNGDMTGNCNVDPGDQDSGYKSGLEHVNNIGFENNGEDGDGKDDAEIEDDDDSEEGIDSEDEYEVDYDSDDGYEYEDTQSEPSYDDHEDEC